MRSFVCIAVMWAMAAVALPAASNNYQVGVGDVLQVNVLQPEKSSNQTTVSPDGLISVVYIGTVYVKGLSITQIENLVQRRLAHGYLKYPVVQVSLMESRSRKFTISGEVNRPGTYSLEENTTVLKAISIAGGFTKFGKSSKVKVLRPKKNAPGYDATVVNINDVMNGKAEVDIVLEPGDIVVVSESLF